MIVGISTSCFYPQEPEQALKTIAELGIEVIEVFFNSPCECNDDYIEMLKKLTRKYGLKVISVHPYCSAYEYLYLFSDYNRRRQDGLNDYKRIINAGSALGAKYVSFHGDRLNSPFDTTIDNYCDALKSIMEVAHNNNMLLAQENVSWCKSSDISFLNQVDRGLAPYGLKYTFDIKQSIRASTPYTQYIDIMKNNIVNVHISDSDKENTCLVPSYGDFNFEKLKKELQMAGYNNALIIECYRHNYADFDELRVGYKYLKKLI